MRSGSLWRHLQQLGGAFTASHSAPASNEAILIKTTFVSGGKPVEQLWKLCESREPEYWDTPEQTTPSQLSQEVPSVDQNRTLREREWDHDEDKVFTRDRKFKKGTEDLKMSRDDEGIQWGQQHVRVRDHETRQRTSLSPNPPPKFQQDDVYIPVKACYISRSVDLKRLSEEPFLEITPSRNNLIIRFTNRPANAKPTSNRPGFAEISRSQDRYMVAFQYGSIVFFNFCDDEEEEALSALSKFCTDKFRETRKDDYGVLVRPTLRQWSEGGQDRIMLRMLDTDNIRVISSILGQSIALDHYAKKVDEMVNTFSELNRGMENTGTFTMTRKSLFQLVAAANTTLADVILRLGLLERSDAAWKDANYAQIWEYLRDDFELDERFESLDFKLNIIQHNVRFFLEILQNRKSDTLEWIIILLITGEICVGVYQILLETNVV
ncbi:protein RETARDED ROOT GROWTH, mitochondrial isoform X2 [Physcomitrium patens]|uniref:protein RETARDED ROOT GROWTH, mitochondrial isoform X2 n=1 Tax=Physcomitrium patens TaxID=3218 RepID=UPI003CCD5356